MGKSKEFEERIGQFSKRTSEEARKLGKIGGVKSGEVRRLKKTIYAYLDERGITEETTLSHEEARAVVDLITRNMIMRPKDELEEIQSDKKQPVLLGIIAKGLFGKDGYKNMRRALGFNDSNSINIDMEDKTVTFAWVDE